VIRYAWRGTLAFALMLCSCIAHGVPPSEPLAQRSEVPPGPIFIVVDTGAPRAGEAYTAEEGTVSEPRIRDARWVWAADLAQTLEAMEMAPRVVTSEAAIPAHALVITRVAPDPPACTDQWDGNILTILSVGVIPLRDCLAGGYRFELGEPGATAAVDVDARYRFVRWLGWFSLLLALRQDYTISPPWGPNDAEARERLRAALAAAAARLSSPDRSSSW
jgi:hypothetical protein